MKPTLNYNDEQYLCSTLPKQSTIPNLSSMINVQHKTKTDLSEDEGLFIGYGKVEGCFPYKIQNQYDAVQTNKNIKTAVLENDYLKATFLPEFGGRLWELIDKKTGNNLLYTNDVIQIRNLALRNAWFSGGVEWNAGFIGHSPFTCDKVYTADFVKDDGTPVLRFYEFERVRRVAFQIDFWLEKDSNILFCRMRIDNRSDETIPMYWWSNIAVPENEGGRIVVPAKSAYTNGDDGFISKIDMPYHGGIDLTYYDKLPKSIDYFFNIEKSQKKYMANFNKQGYGLLQMSSNRLQGRKLFSWGHLQGSDHWQEILTNKAGKYIEIQAGLAKTQYECLPMPPHTAWEWIEGYTAIKVNPKDVFGEYGGAVRTVNSFVEDIWSKVDFNKKVKATKETIGKNKATVKIKGSGFGELENKIRRQKDMPSVSEHLEFYCDENTKQWEKLLTDGEFDETNINEPPKSFITGDDWIELLEKSVHNKNKENWYAWYQLGITLLNKGEIKRALECLKESIVLSSNQWNNHAIAFAYNKLNDKRANYHIYKAAKLSNNDYSICEDSIKLLLENKQYTSVEKLYNSLSETLQQNQRLQMYVAFSCAYMGNIEKADNILQKNKEFMVDDIREGERSISELWTLLYKLKNPNISPKNITIPKQFDFMGI